MLFIVILVCISPGFEFVCCLMVVVIVVVVERGCIDLVV